MKIDRLEIQNIQSHANSKLELHPNFNLIIGNSDNGKSVIVKALRFLIENKSSRKIRRNNTKLSSVSISSKKVKITRSKGDSVNSYKLENGIHKIGYEAVDRHPPPARIEKLLNLGSSNIQRQIDNFFLLNESDGTVAKILNSVSGVSYIDNCSKLATKAIDGIASDIRSLNKQIEQKETFIHESEWLMSADKELAELEALDKSINDIHYRWSELCLNQRSLEVLIQEFNSMLPTSLIKDYDDIVEFHNEISELQITLGKLVHYSKSFEDLEIQLDTIEEFSISQMEEDFEELYILEDEIKTLRSKIDAVSSYNRYHFDYKLQLSRIENYLANLETILNKMKCPTCGSFLKNGDLCE